MKETIPLQSAYELTAKRYNTVFNEADRQLALLRKEGFSQQDLEWLLQRDLVEAAYSAAGDIPRSQFMEEVRKQYTPQVHVHDGKVISYEAPEAGYFDVDFAPEDYRRMQSSMGSWLSGISKRHPRAAFALKAAGIAAIGIMGSAVAASPAYAGDWDGESTSFPALRFPSGIGDYAAVDPYPNSFGLSLKREIRLNPFERDRSYGYHGDQPLNSRSPELSPETITAASGSFVQIKDLSLSEFGDYMQPRDSFEKALLLGLFGHKAGNNYKESFRNVSPGAVYNSVQESLRTGNGKALGMCGSIHYAVARLGKAMGSEASGVFVGETRSDSHFASFHSFGDGIVIVDYGDVLFTGSHDIREALMRYQALQGVISLHHSLYDDDGKFIYAFDSWEGELFNKAINPPLRQSMAPFMRKFNVGEEIPAYGIGLSSSDHHYDIKFTMDQSQWDAGILNAALISLGYARLFGREGSALRNADLLTLRADNAGEHDYIGFSLTAGHVSEMDGTRLMARIAGSGGSVWPMELDPHTFILGIGADFDLSCFLNGASRLDASPLGFPVQAGYRMRVHDDLALGLGITADPAITFANPSNPIMKKLFVPHARATLYALGNPDDKPGARSWDIGPYAEWGREKYTLGMAGKVKQGGLTLDGELYHIASRYPVFVPGVPVGGRFSIRVPVFGSLEAAIAATLDRKKFNGKSENQGEVSLELRASF